MRFIQVTPVGSDPNAIINIDAIVELNPTSTGTIIKFNNGREKIVTETLAQLQTKAAAATPY